MSKRCTVFAEHRDQVSCTRIPGRLTTVNYRVRYSRGRKQIAVRDVPVAVRDVPANFSRQTELGNKHIARIRAALPNALRRSVSGINIPVSVPQPRLTLSKILDRLEKFYGPQKPSFPVDPYEFLVWWYCGYPASDTACSKGWNSLVRDVGIDPGKLLKAKPAKLALAIKPGGMLPELRAQRLQELAFRVENEFGGDLRAALAGPVPKARKLLKSFHGIADPGADRILLFAGISPTAAVPSNCTGVLLRILKNAAARNYSATYREEQRVIASELPETGDARARAYLLLRTHGQHLCKRSNPKCTECPLRQHCAYAALNFPL